MKTENLAVLKERLAFLTDMTQWKFEFQTDEVWRKKAQAEADALTAVLGALEAKQPVPQQSFREAADPLIKWLNDNVHPHHSVIVTPTGAELLEGQCSTGQVLDHVRG